MFEVSGELSGSQQSWDCFAGLEQELENSNAFVAIKQDNFHQCLDHYQSILLKACAEIRKIHQGVSGKALEVAHSVKECIHAITHHCHDFFNIEIHMPINNHVIKPWSACAQGNDPEFWKKYCDIHDASLSVKATLQDAINALAALFALLLAFD